MEIELIKIKMLTLHPILISNHSSHCLSVLVKDDSSFNYPHKPGHGRPNVMPSGPKEQSQVLFKVIIVHMFCVFLSLIFTEKKCNGHYSRFMFLFPYSIGFIVIHCLMLMS